MDYSRNTVSYQTTNKMEENDCIRKRSTNKSEYSKKLEDDFEISTDENDDNENDMKDDTVSTPKSYMPKSSPEQSKLLENNDATNTFHSSQSVRSPIEHNIRLPFSSPGYYKESKDSQILRNQSSDPKSKRFSIHRNYRCLCIFLLLGIVPYTPLGGWIYNEVLAKLPILMQELPNSKRIEQFDKDLQSIKDKFPQQNRRTWSDIQAGVEDVLNASEKPWIYVLFSNETAITTCLAKLLGSAISKALGSESSLVLRPQDMGNEYGETIDRLEPIILKKKAVVVHDLLNIHPGAIQAFHTMCDRETPLIKEAIYILTIITPSITIPLEKPEEFVEKILTEKFMNKVDEDKLQPLITRITDGPIIHVIPGNIPIKCNL